MLCARQEQSAAVLAAGGLLEGCLRAARPLPASSAGLLLLEDVVSSSCQQAAAACAERRGRHAAEGSAPGDVLWRDAAALALTELHQVLAPHLSCLLLCVLPPAEQHGETSCMPCGRQTWAGL
jgi:hypothetical protein